MTTPVAAVSRAAAVSVPLVPSTRTPLLRRLRLPGSSSRKPTGRNGEVGSCSMRRASWAPASPAP
ncbi:MAG TPA: hypothetical protein VLJ59_03880 [Mycobacteriales bacterium]|nr:hypothetical protein [Mycobacteriales bacterium]